MSPFPDVQVLLAVGTLTHGPMAIGPTWKVPLHSDTPMSRRTCPGAGPRSFSTEKTEAIPVAIGGTGDMNGARPQNRQSDYLKATGNSGANVDRSPQYVCKWKSRGRTGHGYAIFYIKTWEKNRFVLLMHKGILKGSSKK